MPGINQAIEYVSAIGEDGGDLNETKLSVTIIEESPPRAQMLSRVGSGKYERLGRSF